MTITTPLPRTLLSLAEEIAETERQIARWQLWLDELYERQAREEDPMDEARNDAGFVAWLRGRR